MKPKANTLARARKELELSSEKESGARDLRALKIILYIRIYILVFKLIAISLIIIIFKNYPY